MLQRILLLPWFGKKGVEVLTEVSCKAVTGSGLVVVDKGGRERTIEADTVMVTLPLQPATGLYESLKGKAPEVYNIGDAGKPGLIMDAIAAGFEVGRKV
jgi:NADPH-dependent 2,4-dienoyl-CoA reductase/sulfur reductase-like enzyme